MNGDGAAELYQFLKAAAPDEEGNQDIPWNFTKFLVDKSGNVVKRYGPQVTPEDVAADVGQYL